MADTPPMLRPVPRRAFELTPTSSESSIPPSPPTEPTNPKLLSDRKQDGLAASRTRSILNLTSSTLFGIYANSGHDGAREESSTPWGTGAQTPSHRKSLEDSRPVLTRTKSGQGHERPKILKPGVLEVALRLSVLFAFGTAYGTIVTHLHRTQNITPIHVPGVEDSWNYQLIAWGLSGVVLGNALPWLDDRWTDLLGDGSPPPRKQNRAQHRGSFSDSRGVATSDEDDPSAHIGDWYSAVRSIGAFVGIAFAVVSELRTLLHTRADCT